VSNFRSIGSGSHSEVYPGFLPEVQSRSDLPCKWFLSSTYAFARATLGQTCIISIVFFFTRDIQNVYERLNLRRLLSLLRMMSGFGKPYRKIARISLCFSFSPSVRSIFFVSMRFIRTIISCLIRQTTARARRRRHLIAHSYLLDKHLPQCKLPLFPRQRPDNESRRLRVSRSFSYSSHTRIGESGVMTIT